MTDYALVFDPPVETGSAHDSQTTARVRVEVRGQIPEYAQIWVWNRLYAQQLHALGDTPWAQELKEILEIWAVNMSSKVFQPRDLIRLKGHDRLSERLDLQRSPPPASAASETASRETASPNEHRPAAADPKAPSSDPQVVSIRVVSEPDGLPSLRVAPDLLPASLRYWSVLALAQHFIFDNPMFLRELPIHILAFRKFHADVHPFHSDLAVSESPEFAMAKAMAYFSSAGGSRH